MRSTNSDKADPPVANELVAEIREGSESAFAELFSQYYRQLYRYAWRYSGNQHTAEDIVQEVFVKIWRKRKSWQIRTSLKSYLYTAVRNTAITHLKHFEIVCRSEGRLLDTLPAVMTPEEVLETKDIGLALEAAVRKLPEQGRQILLLKKYDGLSYAEIAEVHDISVNTVKTHLVRAMKHLRRQLSHLLMAVL